MRRIIDYFRGCCRLTIEGCQPERCLRSLLSTGIAFWDIRKSDEYTLSLTVYRANASAACALCRLCQCDAHARPLRSFRGDFYGLKRRWALLLGLCIVIFAMAVLPRYIFLLDVEGCAQVPKEEILRVLAEEGVGFGTLGTDVNNEMLRNNVLRKIPELRWMAVNQSGMRATVLVAERTEPEPTVDRRIGVTNLIACADGIITGMNVLNGQAACKPGDAVTKGDVLISGLMDVERVTVPTRALGEVYADTRRKISVVTPQNRLRREPDGVAGRCFYLIAGRKRIKICGSSGIFMGDCVKIIRRVELRLPGGYPVPLALCTETYYRTAPQELTLSEEAARTIFDDYLSRRIDRELVAGRVLTARSELQTDGGLYTLQGTYHCHEMIARSAEIPILELEQHGTNDQRGTDGTAD